MTDLERAALVISECQRGILDPGVAIFKGIADHATDRGMVPNIARLVQAFRAAGRPVVHCTIQHRPDLAGVLPNSMLGSMTLRDRRMIAGSPDVEIPAEIAPRVEDFVSCRATGITAFYGTDLDATLRLQGVDTIVLTGVSTNLALPGFSIEAVNRGYRVILPEDATAGTSAELHSMMITNLLAVLTRVTTTDAVLAQLNALPRSS